MRILVADDHQLIRDGLRLALVEASDITEIGEAGSGQEALDAVRTGHWEVMILDINLPGKSGLDVLAELKQEKNHIPVLMLSVYPPSQFGPRALRSGASGYLSKSATSQELLQAIRKVAKGGKYISDELAEQLVTEIDETAAQEPHSVLSDREFQVFLGLGAGKTVGEVAREMNLNVKTISTYRAHILEKMQLQNNAQIIRYAMLKGLVP
jgi:DNA-binding NarL/FixJ family response regulator